MSDVSTSEFSNQVRANQDRLSASLQRGYDYIICGAGSAGSVVAARLAANTDAKILVLEAGGTDDLEITNDPNRWPMTLGSELDWGFTAEANPRLNNRAIGYSMGKALGGGSTINVSTWSRGHRADWDFYAAETGDAAWNYESVLGLYRDRVESWTGASDVRYRGTNGTVHVQPSSAPHAFAAAFLQGAQSIGIERFPNPNGLMMESDGGSSIIDETVRNSRRQSIFRSYLYPLLDRNNVTVLTGAVVNRVLFTNQRASGIEFSYGGKDITVRADREIVLSLGAIHTPKLLMQSGIGDERELDQHRIPVIQSLPGVGRNLHDHVSFGVLYEKTELSPFAGSRSETVAFWKSAKNLDSPDFYTYASQHPFITPENAASMDVPAACWSLVVGMRPKSRGSIRLTGPSATDPLKIDAGYLADPDDLDKLVSGIQVAQQLGRSDALKPFTRRQVAPISQSTDALETYLRNGLGTFWHQCGTAKMGRDTMSVVDGNLKVHGIEGLRVADASVMPRVTTGNTMAPCVIIGEQAARFMMKQ
ncbi:choline dehydrogenase [Paraburkholderia sp. GAS41]|jgi:choline dehydrogenase|uniref:GMC family oxidoreductase n=1 Tax=Paraburkholderia sp. GAS41 TaxID=3035134 RepID=UPI003D257E1F